MSAKAMIKKSVLESAMYNQTISLSTLITIMVDMALALVVGLLIYSIYKKFYTGVIYSRSFALTLVGMTVLTCMVTLAISTNIVISLGMVGALSIVRYRTAIKEPLDILYLFWAITTGITIGASMYLLAAVGMLFMLLLLMTMSKKKTGVKAYIMIAHLAGAEAERSVLESLSKLEHEVKSKTTRGGSTELTLQVECAEKDLVIADEVRALNGVNDVTLIAYNGEYHG
ncbi:MAG: DUF4956 domain-containing protein [Lachnospiraceae bacterium]|nr:DUF4956 domain-containing protein [Lachnospiraceae bacterium]